MTPKLAEIGPNDRVLDVGAGSGYQTALLAHLCQFAYGIEIIPALAERASASLRAVGVQNGVIHLGMKRPSPQHLVRVIRKGSSFVREDLGKVYFVPFVERYQA